MADGEVRHALWRPGGTTWLAAALEGLDALFDRVYTSRDNPLHRTGTLAALLLTVALVTGVYLLLVYEVGRPYESVAAIQRDALLGRWIRALHRYASDAAVVAVALHVVRLVVQGKSWGPRTLAWITGVLLTGMMFVSALTGFVLVWDELGQKLAVAGARMLRLLPLFTEPPDRAFVGDRPVPAPFFFMNLFLHVAVPLGMVCFLWLHTSKLARAAWFPERRVVWGALAGLVVLAVAWPAPLPPAADLLAIPGRTSADWFYGFWLPLAEASPPSALTVLVALTALAVAVPWLLRPRRQPPAAVVDPERCEGCEQCFVDCPYDAVAMVPGLHPERHPLRASIQPDLCVSCGLCAGSCSSLAIGPPGRTARHQIASARELVVADPAPAARMVLVVCRNNGGAATRLRAGAAGAGTATFEVDCAGTVHPATVSYLASHFGRTMVLACPPQNCVHREGATLADARILRERRPAIPGRIAGQFVRVTHHSAAEWRALLAAIRAFQGSAAPTATPRAVARGLGAAAFSALLLAGVALASRWPQGTEAEHALLRLGWRLAGQVRETCRDLTPDELARRPVHMRQPRECSSEVLPYRLYAAVDGAVMVERMVRPRGLRADRPLSVEEDLPIAPGEHMVRVTFTPEDAAGGGRTLAVERRIRFERRRVVLVTHEDDALTVRQARAGAAPQPER